MSNSVYHGGRLDLAIKQFGGTHDEWLDLSTGINPNAYRVPVFEDAIWQRLPDVKALEELLNAARRYYKVPDNASVVAASGTQALIELLPHVLPSKRVTIISPTYGEHAHCWRKAGAHVELISKGDDIPRLNNTLLVVNPNNPDAKIHTPEELSALAKQMKQYHGILIIDEAFCDPEPENSIVPNLPDNVIVYRSFGKFFGLAGLRLGFLIGPASVVHPLENLLGPWSVSGPALEIGKQAFADEKWIRNTCEQLKNIAGMQAKLIASHGLEVCGVNPLFIYVGHEEASAVYNGLAKRKILVRPFPENKSRLRFGLCKNDEELSRLDAALKLTVADK